ncbi:hypothetical protein Hanom_Chr01g00040861 [Helianthus anomalus]
MHKRIFKDCKAANPLVHGDEQNYNPDTDPTWIEIKNGVEKLFRDGDDDGAPPLIQHPVVVQPHVDLQKQPPKNLLLNLLQLKSQLKKNQSIISWYENKCLIKFPADDKERLEVFRNKVASLSPSSDWVLRLVMWNNKLNDLKSAFNSTTFDDNNDDRRPPVFVIQRN